MNRLVCLILKVGSLIILLWNINSPKLRKGTRLAVKKILPNLIEATILTAKSKGEVCLIPRIPMIPKMLCHLSSNDYNILWVHHLRYPSTRPKGKHFTFVVWIWRNNFFTWPTLCCLFQSRYPPPYVYSCSKWKNKKYCFSKYFRLSFKIASN